MSTANVGFVVRRIDENERPRLPPRVDTGLRREGGTVENVDVTIDR